MRHYKYCMTSPSGFQPEESQDNNKEISVTQSSALFPLSVIPDTFTSPHIKLYSGTSHISLTGET